MMTHGLDDDYTNIQGSSLNFTAFAPPKLSHVTAIHLMGSAKITIDSDFIILMEVSGYNSEIICF